MGQESDIEVEETFVVDPEVEERPVRGSHHPLSGRCRWDVVSAVKFATYAVDELADRGIALSVGDDTDSDVSVKDLKECLSYLYTTLVVCCHDCGINLVSKDEYFLPTEEVWAKHGVGHDYLCLNCLEERAQRPLRGDDFKLTEVNSDNPRVRKIVEESGRRFPVEQSGHGETCSHLRRDVVGDC